ncbi:MAG: hypothetical protein BJ554DRAFT_7767, partial [Olpidium bornovanus]
CAKNFTNHAAAPADPGPARTCTRGILHPGHPGEQLPGASFVQNVLAVVPAAGRAGRAQGGPPGSDSDNLNRVYFPGKAPCGRKHSPPAAGTSILAVNTDSAASSPLPGDPRLHNFRPRALAAPLAPRHEEGVQTEFAAGRDELAFDDFAVIALVKGSAPALAERGVEITTRFYERLFKLHPDLRSQAALAAAVHAYAANIDNLGALGPAQYPVVGENLLWAVKDVLGDAATPQLLDAWAAAYARLADIFIRAEADLDEIVSFYLTPQDGRALPKFKPGQHVSVRVFVPELRLYRPREYSLSDAPNDKMFRISVKREFAVDARHAGRVSNLLHEGSSEGSELEVTHPYGDFTLVRSLACNPDLDAETPVVLLGGGVGLTPLISMLSAIVEQGKT